MMHLHLHLPLLVLTVVWSLAVAHPHPHHRRRHNRQREDSGNAPQQWPRHLFPDPRSHTMEDDTTTAEDSTTTSSSGRDPTRLDPIRIEDGDLLIGRADDEDVGELTDLYEYFTEEEMNELRSQIIMQQIREKLRMTSPLNRTLIEAAKRRLPEPLEKELTHELEMMQSDQWHPPADYFYGKNMQTVIFAKKSNKCPIRHKSSAACFEVDIPEDIDPDAVSLAKLLVYKRRDPGDAFNQTLQVYELTGPNHSVPKSRKYHGYKVVNMKRGWVEFDMYAAVQMWAGQDTKTRIIEIICKTCRPGTPVEVDGDLVPFVEIKMQPKGYHRRHRRSHTLAPCHTRHRGCCKRSQYIDFGKLGEDSWIQQPKGFYANYCSGSCSIRVNPAGVAPDFRHRLLQNIELARKVLNLCCVPTRLSPISILYWDVDGRLHQTEMPNMVVDECGCR